MKKSLFLASVALTAIALAGEAHATQAGDIIVRGRALTVAPQEDATISGAVTGSSINIDTSVVPEVDMTYFITPNIGFEAIGAITPHNVKAKGTSAGDLDLGDVWLLPPTVTAQYHFMPDKQFKPYIGGGINYTHFFDADAGSSITSIKYQDSVGPALQVGFDYMLDDHWMLNTDVKKLWINSDVSINGGAVRADVDINPWVVGVGLGYKF